MNAKDIGATLKALRQAAGHSTTSLAAAVGLSQAQISRLENGLQGFRSDTIFKLAKALRVPPYRFFMSDAEWKKIAGKCASRRSAASRSAVSKHR